MMGGMAFAELMGQFHPMLIHFPIAFWCVAFVVDLIAFCRGDERLGKFSLALLCLGTVISGFTGVSGIMAQVVEVRRGIPEDPTEYHERWALLTMGWFIAVTLFRLYYGPASARWIRWSLLASFAVGIAMLAYTAHHGGELVQTYGATVQGVEPLHEPSDEALQLVASRQKLSGREYSTMMHVAAGIMSVLLAVFLFVAQARPSIQEKVNAVTPWLLILGGVGLFVFSDTDSFPLDDQRGVFSDPEIIFHKVVSFLMIGCGWYGARRGIDRGRAVGRSIGLLSLAGGALLFTHIHSAAPYADVAIGVYMYHTVMASISLAIGVVKLSEEKFSLNPYWFPGLIAVEAVLLLTYTEGMPWFLGYERFLREGPHNEGFTSQVGRGRAELVYDPDSTRMQVYLYELREDKPWEVAAQPMAAKVFVGRRVTSATLLPSGPGRFEAPMPFLRGRKIFAVEIAVPGTGDRVEFEPWTVWKEGELRLRRPIERSCLFDPATDLGSAPICPTCGRASSKEIGASFAKWCCPVHATVGHGEQTTCALCGRWMQLNPRRPIRESAGSMTIADGKIRVSAGKLSALRGERGHVDVFGPHGYSHLHLNERDEAPVDLSRPGRYVFFASHVPEGGTLKVLRDEWNVPGASASAAVPGEGVTDGPYRISVRGHPYPPGPNDQSTLFVDVEKDGRPVLDLEPVEGMPAMCVVVSEDLETFECAHPVGKGALRFHWYPPKLGRYLVWLTFRHEGQTRTVAMSLIVSERALPRALDLGER